MADEKTTRFHGMMGYERSGLNKYEDKLKSKNWTAQKNELLCKLIAHNIVVLIHEMHELGISPDFSTHACN